MRRKKFEMVGYEYIKIQDELRSECLKYLRKTLKSRKDKSITWDTKNALVDCSVYVTYDGVSPNPFSEVYGVFLKGSDVYVNCENDSEYLLDHATTDDIYELCLFIENVSRLSKEILRVRKSSESL